MEFNDNPFRLKWVGNSLDGSFIVPAHSGDDLLLESGSLLLLETGSSTLLLE